MIATGQTLQRAGKECMAKGSFDVQKKRVCKEIIAFSPQFYHKWIKITLILGKCKFLLELPRNMLSNIPINFSPCVRSVVKSSSCNGLDILQNWPQIVRKYIN